MGQLVSVDVSDSFSSILCKISSARPATHHQPELVNLMVDLSFSSPVFIHVVIVLINDFVIIFSFIVLLLVRRGPEEHSVINCFIHIYVRLMGGSASIHTKMKYQCYHVRQNNRINFMAN